MIEVKWYAVCLAVSVCVSSQPFLIGREAVHYALGCVYTNLVFASSSDLRDKKPKRPSICEEVYPLLMIDSMCSHVYYLLFDDCKVGLWAISCEL